MGRSIRPHKELARGTRARSGTLEDLVRIARPGLGVGGIAATEPFCSGEKPVQTNQRRFLVTSRLGALVAIFFLKRIR
jgi:hypothetical protein